MTAPATVAPSPARNFTYAFQLGRHVAFAAGEQNGEDVEQRRYRPHRP